MVAVSILQIIDEVPEIARLLVLEMDRINKPQSDMMSSSQAFREYGQAWVKKHLASGELRTLRHGNRKMVSRAEMERIKAKENAAARLLIRKKKKSC